MPHDTPHATSHDTPHTEIETTAPPTDSDVPVEFPTDFGRQTPSIELIDVSRTYESVTAVESVSFTATTGEFHAIVGPNGSGKTTVGRIAVGLTRPTSGTVSVPADEVGYAFQRPRYYPKLSVRENVTTFRRAVGDEAAPSEWHDQLLDALRLDRVEGQPVAELSGGFRKKLDLAIALLRRPSFLWLDEPLAALDPAAVSRVVQLLDAYVDAGGGVIVSTHTPVSFESVLTHLTVCPDGTRLETHDLREIPPETNLRAFYRDRVTSTEPST